MNLIVLMMKYPVTYPDKNHLKFSGCINENIIAAREITVK
jgi:hypothetical protein